MKTVALKTEDHLKYLSVLLLEDDWNVELKNKETAITNINTNQTYCFLDLNQESTVVFDSVQNIPENWHSRSFYYLPNEEKWIDAFENKQIEIISEKNSTFEQI